MGTICGHCNRRFPSTYSPLMIWCKPEEMYVCRRCWEDVCGEGHGKGDKNAGWHPVKAFVFACAMLSMVWAFAFFGTMDIYLRNDWNSLETTDISELPENGVVKLEGTIMGRYDDIELSGEEHSGRSDYHWDWYANETFYINDTTGSVKVTAERFYAIEDGPHAAPHREHTDGTVYRGGDRIVMVGEVAEDGELVYLLWIGPEGSELETPIWSWVLALVIIIPMAIGFIAFYAFAHKRNRLHKEKVGYTNPIEIQETEMMKRHELDWRRNSSLSRKGLGVVVAIFIISGFVVLFIIFGVFGEHIHTYDDYLLTSMAGMMIFPFMMFFPLIFYFENSSVKPDELAVSDEGVHFYYKDPILRFLKDDFVGWGEIKDIAYHSSGKSGYWSIDKKNDTQERITYLSTKNRKMVRAKWKEIKRRVRRS